MNRLADSSPLSRPSRERAGVRVVSQETCPWQALIRPSATISREGREKGLPGLIAAFLVLAIAPAHSAESLADIPLMQEEARAAGINNTYDGPWEFFVGGGGAALDCDGSGFPSVFLAGGKNPAHLYVNKSTPGGPLKFEEKPLGLDKMEGVLGAYPLDIDGDGHMDLFVMRVGGSLLAGLQLHQCLARMGI